MLCPSLSELWPHFSSGSNGDLPGTQSLSFRLGDTRTPSDVSRDLDVNEYKLQPFMGKNRTSPQKNHPAGVEVVRHFRKPCRVYQGLYQVSTTLTLTLKEHVELDKLEFFKTYTINPPRGQDYFCKKLYCTHVLLISWSLSTTLIPNQGIEPRIGTWGGPGGK